MARRYDIRKIKIHHSYTITDVAHLLGVTPHTVRRWTMKGLSCLRDKKPYLILGRELKPWLEALNSHYRHSLGADEFMCMKCRQPRLPAEGIAIFIPDSTAVGRLEASCAVCGTAIMRFSSSEQVQSIMPNVTVSWAAGEPTLNDTATAPSNVHFKKGD